MKAQKAPSYAIVLGAINGLLVGGIAYLILQLLPYSENRALRNAQLYGGDAMHVSVGIDWWAFPLIGALAFTVGSYIVHRFLGHRINSTVWIWQLVGVASAICGMLIILIVVLIDHSSGAAPIDFENPNVSGLLWTCSTVFAYVAVFNLLYGPFSQLVVVRFCESEPFVERRG